MLSATLLLSAIALLHPVGASAALIDNGDGTVSDESNPYIMWTQEAFSGTWDAAQSHRLEGKYGDWRLPTVEELKSLYPIDTDVFEHSGVHYWTIELHGNNPDFARTVNFDNGNTPTLARRATASYRLIRDQPTTVHGGQLVDYTLDGTGELRVRVVGGDGGKRRNGSTHYRDGGGGATIDVSFVVGPDPGSIPENSKLRVIAGEAGRTANTDRAEGSGGGAGSALLLLTPENAPDWKWEILAVAGGGGGAYSDCCEYKDRGGNASGDLQQITPGDKRIACNENSESDDGVGGYAYDSGPGGGAWYGGIGVTSIVKNEGGTAGFTWVRQGVLEIQLPIGSPGGKDGTRGGWGFGGGGSSAGSLVPGGGGGGYCGGDGGDTAVGFLGFGKGGGNGGGSYITEDYTTFDVSRQDGVRTPDSNDGYVTLGFGGQLVAEE